MPDIAELYRAHSAGLVRLADSYVHDHAAAEDVVQDVFARFFAATELRNPDAAAGYLAVAVINRALSFLRRRNTFAVDEVPEPGVAPSAEDLAVERAQRTAVLAAIRTLPRQQRAVLTLRYYGGLMEPEIADALHISRGAVKAHAARGKRHLAAALTDTREDTP